jgi:hypothetical protein
LINFNKYQIFIVADVVVVLDIYASIIHGGIGKLLYLVLQFGFQYIARVVFKITCLERNK